MREGKENSTKTLFSRFQVHFLKKRAELHNLKNSVHNWKTQWIHTAIRNLAILLGQF